MVYVGIVYIYVYMYNLFYMHSDYTGPGKKLKQEREDFTESDTECVGVKERGWM